MNGKDISLATDPDVRASLAAMQRAADLARKIAIQTDTDLIIMEDGRLTRIPAAALREAAANSEATSK